MSRARGPALLIAAALAALASQAAALELMSGNGFLLALAEGEATRKAANDYLAGTIDSLIVVNEVVTAEQGRMFCLSDQRAKLLDHPLLRQEFTDWLRSPGSAAPSELAAGRLPVSMLAWSFLAQKFPCAATQPDALDESVRSRLLDSMRQ